MLDFLFIMMRGVDFLRINFSKVDEKYVNLLRNA